MSYRRYATDPMSGAAIVEPHATATTLSMARWQEDYRGKVVSPEMAAGMVNSRDRIYVQGGAGTPDTLIWALMSRASELHDVEIVHMHSEMPAPYTAPEMAGHFRHNSLFMGRNVRGAVNAGRADFTPIFLSEIPQLFVNGILPIDVAFIHVSPPDEHGYCSYGISVDCSKPAAEAATIVIAQVNPLMPRTLGDSVIHVSYIDAIVEAAVPLPEVQAPPSTPVQKAIGQHIASLIEDGSTLQMGIGGIPDAVLPYLRDKRDLGIHTEMFADGVLDLIEAGIINNQRKTLHRGKIISSFLMGTRRLYDFVDNNPAVELHPANYTNDPFIISRNDKMVAINSALEVDLTGQVCADSIGCEFYSGVGGQVDFVRGAAASRGGKPIIALPSTAKSGRMSRIKPVLTEGAGVVTSRADVHYIVTEHGIAQLHGRTVRQRAEMLIEIAHPDFRAELRDFAKGKHYFALAV